MREDEIVKKLLFTLFASFTIFLSAPAIVEGSPLAYPVERISGQDRVETALSISQKGWLTADTVILCEYNDYPDSIASTPYAVSVNAPILLTGGTNLDSRVKAEIQRLQPSKIVLLGGTGVMKTTIEEEVMGYEFVSEVERIGGNNRYETSVLLAKKISNSTVILANGDDFPDALSAASFAGFQQIPIVLTSKKLPESVLNYLNEVQPSEIIAIGGEGVIPTESLTEHNLTINTRLGGNNRYETNAAVVNHVQDFYGTDDLFLASGITFPDAVAGTVLAATYKAPLLLTEKEDIPVSIYTYMREHMKVEPPRKKNPNNNSGNNSSNQNTKEAKINPAGGLNLRSSPSSSGERLAIIPQDTVIKVVAEENGWVKTTYEGVTGWLSGNYLTFITNSNNNSPKPVTPVIKEAKINPTGGLNLRSTPSSSGEKLATVPHDTIIQILAEDNGWVKTTYNGATGWLSANYLTYLEIEKPPISGVVTANSLNLRSTPSSTGEKLNTIAKDTNLVILEEETGWYKVEYDSQTGWVASDYVRLLEEEAGEKEEPAEPQIPEEPEVPEVPEEPEKNETPSIDLSVNGKVYILGGTGVISSNAQSIIAGQALSKYKENNREFPPLPSEIKKEEPPSRGDGPEIPLPTDPENPSPTQPETPIYDPEQEIWIDPFIEVPYDALIGKTIMIDPGHGGPDSGAVGPSKTYEKNNTLAIALALQTILEEAGADVIMTRTGDYSPAATYTELEDLKARVALANGSIADLFISIHNDGFTNPETQGSSVFYSSGNPKVNESLHLASSIRSSLIPLLETRDRGVKAANFYVIRNTTIPSALVEVAFISNPYEEARLQNPTFQHNAAVGIFHGIFKYFNTPIPKS